VPIDSDPDRPDSATPAVDRQPPTALDREHSPDAPASLETPGNREPRKGSGTPDSREQESDSGTPGSREAQDDAETAGSRQPRNGGEAVALWQQQIAEHARYQQAADAAYQVAARQEWANAVPGLRAAWEEHRERFPERVRPAERDLPAARTQPDGGWVTEGGRLAGLEHMVKGEERLKEKIAGIMEVPGVSVREAMELVPDAVRYTLTYDDAGRYADGVLAGVDGLKAEGFELIKLKNLWHADQYKGVNSQWRRPDTGLRFEMQFHTLESLEAKELTHEAYERFRGQAISETEKLELQAFQRRVSALLATPPGTDRIKDFLEQDDDRQSHLLRDDRRAHQPGKAANGVPAG
jgi:hypothetical protein